MNRCLALSLYYLMHYTTICYCPPEPTVKGGVSFKPTPAAVVLPENHAENHTTVTTTRLSDSKEDTCIRLVDMTASWSMSAEKITLNNISCSLTKVSE